MWFMTTHWPFIRALHYCRTHSLNYAFNTCALEGLFCKHIIDNHKICLSKPHVPVRRQPTKWRWLTMSTPNTHFATKTPRSNSKAICKRMMINMPSTQLTFQMHWGSEKAAFKYIQTQWGHIHHAVCELALISTSRLNITCLIKQCENHLDIFKKKKGFTESLYNK